MSRKGLILILTAPSGAGKTTLTHALLSADTLLASSISYTTREPRANESNGIDYHFVTKELFQEMITQNAFVEYACVHDQFYGTSLLDLEKLLKTRDVILDIDWQGAFQLRKLYPQAVVDVFVLPPSWEILERRLIQRGGMMPDKIQKRLKTAREELKHISEFEYVVDNTTIEEAVLNLQAILKAARLKYYCRTNLSNFI